MDAGADDSRDQAAEEAQRLAAGGRLRWEEARACRLMGQGALAAGHPSEAATCLRTALTMQEEMGALLEAARTRQLLAETRLTHSGAARISEEARFLLSVARAHYVARGAALDLTQTQQLTANWHTS